MKPDRLSGMLGLCARARRIALGSNLACEAIARGAPLALLAADASANTKKRITDRCAFYGSTCRVLSLTADALGHAVGEKSPVSAAAVEDKNFASALLNILGDGHPDIGSPL